MVLSLVLNILIFNTAVAFEIPNPLKFESVQELIGAITGFIFQLGVIIAPIMFIISGYFFMTSGGEPEKVRKAKNMFVYTLIGLVVVLTATGMYNLIVSILGGTEEEEEEEEVYRGSADPYCFYNESYRQQVLKFGVV